MAIDIANLSIFCTTQCNLSCPLCACQWIMRRYPKYDLSIDALDRFIARCETIDVHFAWAWFTGGEPTLWPDLVEGIKRLHASPSFGKLRIKTNGVHIERLDPVIDKIDEVVITVHHENAKLAASLAGRKKFKFWAEHHRKVPDKPIPNSIPAPCICHHVPFYFDGRLYVCPGVAQVHPKRGIPLEDDDSSCPIERDFVAHFLARQKKARWQEICSQCISNGLVYRAQKHTQEEPIPVGEISVMVGRMNG